MMAHRQSSTSYGAYDLDDDSSYKTLVTKLTSIDSGNFALSFNHEIASASADLNRDELKQWLEDHDVESGVRWLHFWSNADQRPLVEDLAARYDISPRLLSLICPRKPSANIPQPKSSTSNSNAHSHAHLAWPSKTKDVERAVALGTSKNVTASDVLSAKGLSFVDIVNNLWHFHSIDWGHKYVHIWVNTLSVIPGMEHDQISDRPAGQRLWTSILLCDDGTVISSFERPPYHQSDQVNKASNKVVKRHILNIVKHLSRLPDAHSSGTGDLMSVTIRPDRVTTPSKAMSKAERMEHASLLFYYLFDDWMTTFALIAQREHPYRRSIETVRKALNDAPDAKLLEELHSLGRQLTVLQLMYQSYGTVITRLLHRYQSTTYTATNLNSTSSSLQQSQSYSNMTTPMLGIYPSPTPAGDQDCIHSLSTRTPTVQLSFLAIGRFERLLDRVHLYALNEINHCLAEKESLVLMTFNLLALSESRSVEKLTRTTILLAKATILFLPVSLVTSYFSLSVGNIDAIYSLRTYWFSFLVVGIVSIIFLYLFGFATGTIEGKLVYRSLHKALWDKSTAAILRKTGRIVNNTG